MWGKNRYLLSRHFWKFGEQIAKQLWMQIFIYNKRILAEIPKEQSMFVCQSDQQKRALVLVETRLDCPTKLKCPSLSIIRENFRITSILSMFVRLICVPIPSSDSSAYLRPVCSKTLLFADFPNLQRIACWIATCFNSYLLATLQCKTTNKCT